MLDDHSRLFLASRAYPTVKAADVVEAFWGAIALHDAPASLLCDNGAVGRDRECVRICADMQPFGHS